MAHKIGDIVIKLGSYEKNGQKKNRYKHIGKLMGNDDGGQFILLDATVMSMQLFALVNKQRDSHLLCSVFSDDRNQQGQPQGGGDDGIPI